MHKLPNKIEKCPIKEAIFEIRFFSTYPADAIFGVLYTKIKNFFTESPVSLPILQLPEAVRMNDPNLRYQPYYKLSIDNITLNIGPKVLSFVNSSPYSGWSKWSTFFYDILEQVIKTDVLNKIERFGLRYINLFPNENIFGNVKLEIKLIDTLLSKESTNLRTEIHDDEFVKILQVGNAVNFIIDGDTINGSVIDIDCLYNVGDKLDSLEEYRKIIEKAHIKEKELFFSLLTESFLEKLKPVYGD